MFFIILTLLALFFPKPVLAESGVNKYGIHILEPSDLPKAQELVNSSGGDWGWVTVVIRDDDMNHDKWQDFMNECRTRHLIPLVRIATHLEGKNWAKPKINDANNWANFLNSLNWPVSDRYVIIFNEPNQAKEWGGTINPQEYSRILSDFNSKFKIQNSKFKILNAGFDLATSNTKNTMDSYRFMKQMKDEVPDIFEKLDGWASHSYPNHGYLGKPWETGKHSIQGYKWELGVLKNEFGLTKDLPVFITETGWPKNSSKFKVKSSKLKTTKNYYSEKIAAEYVKYAFENVWLKDEKIMAITPFVLNYPEGLFAEFSWLDEQGSPYQQYEEIKALPKISWQPVQEFKSEVLSINLPPFLPVNTNFEGKIVLKNTGESIWGENERKIAQTISEVLAISDLILSENQKVLPGEKIELNLTLASQDKDGLLSFGWEKIGKWQIKVFPASTLTSFRYTFWQKIILKVKNIF